MLKSFSMEMPRKNFSGAPTSFGFSEKGKEEGKHWWMNKPCVERREGSAWKYAEDEEEHESKRLRIIGPPHLTDFKNSVLSVSRTSDFMCQQNQINSTVTSACELSTTALPLSAPMDILRPLGLSLRKSQSLVDLIQQNLNQNEQFSPLDQEGVEDNITKTNGISAADSQQDKLKASNFSACYLKIGKWECSSVYEGDLVAKCYYAKRKLVWEVLGNGLKSKIEIQWSDITGLKANIPEKGPASLHVEISRTPLFFRETNPQPRKHTLWQSTSDFTGGQASICRQHFLQFSEGVLNRHFEKLIQCDPRLKNLSEQSVPFSGSPFFEGRILMLDMHRHQQYIYPGNISSSLTLGSLQNETVMHFNQVSAPIVKQNKFHLMEQSDDRASAELQAFSPSSVMDSRTNDETSTSDTEELYAKEFQRHGGYKKTGISMLFDQRVLFGDGSVLSTMPHSTDMGSTSMVSYSNILHSKVPSSEVPLTENNGTLSEQNFLQRLSNHLFEDIAPEKFLANGRMKEFSGKFTQDAEGKVQQEKLMSHNPSENIRMTDTPIHDHSGHSYTLGLVENLSFPYPVKEEDKCSESQFRPVKIENSISSQLNGSIFSSPPRNSLLHRGQTGLNRYGSFCDHLDSPQVSHLF